MSQELWSSIIRMISAMALVLAAVVVTMALIKRFLGGGLGLGEHAKLVRVLGGSYIGPRKSIVLVEVAGELLALGISGQHITMLTKIDAERSTEILRSVHETRKAPVSFSACLERLLPRQYRIKKG